MKVSLDIDTQAVVNLLDPKDELSFDRYLRGEISRETLMKERGWNDREFGALIQVLVDTAIKSRYNRKRRVGLD